MSREWFGSTRRTRHAVGRTVRSDTREAPSGLGEALGRARTAKNRDTRTRTRTIPFTASSATCFVVDPGIWSWDVGNGGSAPRRRIRRHKPASTSSSSSRSAPGTRLRLSGRVRHPGARLTVSKRVRPRRTAPSKWTGRTTSARCTPTTSLSLTARGKGRRQRSQVTSAMDCSPEDGKVARTRRVAGNRSARCARSRARVF